MHIPCRSTDLGWYNSSPINCMWLIDLLRHLQRPFLFFCFKNHTGLKYFLRVHSAVSDGQFKKRKTFCSFLFFCANKYVDNVRWSLLRIVNTGVESGRSGEQRGHWSRGGVCHNIVKCLLYNKQAWWCTGSSSGKSMWIIIYSHNYISVSIQSIIKRNPLSSLDFSRLDILRSEPDCAFSYYNAVFKLFIIWWEWPVLIRNVDGDPEVDRIAVTQGV